MSADFTAADLAQLAAAGIAPGEAARQLALLRRGQAWITIDRPATRDDGIETLDAASVTRALAAHAAASAAGRVRAFVPASGAASRMFKELLAVRVAGRPDSPVDLAFALAAGDADAKALKAFLDGLGHFAFHGALAKVVGREGLDLPTLAAHGPYRPILDALLGPNGLDAAERPKGVLAFHREGDDVRTAFEEHLVECASVVRDENGGCRLHLTVSPAHRELFDAVLHRARPELEARLGVRYHAGFSVQDPSTDTLAVDGQGRPWRGENGALLLRPAGHGALIHNFDALEADLVFVKNIDNVAHDAWKEPGVRWAQVLLGILAETQERAHALLLRLESGADAADEALAFARETLWRAPLDVPRDAESRRALAIDWLRRPLRVCGMVPNTGEPGGGPFWVRGRDGGSTLQIVESAQVDPADPMARAAFANGTHFNPVFLACAVRDPHGRPYPLESFVDPGAIILTRKSAGGRELVALERPGLWNGAMARWNTRFVEVPLEVFNPVKTVLDLLRPAHQPR